MNHVVINALVHTERDRIVFESPLAGVALFSYLDDAITDVVPDAHVCAFTNSPALAAAMEKRFDNVVLDPEITDSSSFISPRIRLLMQKEMTTPEYRQSEDTSDYLILSPHLGMITKARLRKAVELLTADREHVFVSARRLDSNEHIYCSTMVTPTLAGDTHFCTDSHLLAMHEGGRRYIRNEEIKDKVTMAKNGDAGISLSQADYAVCAMSSPLFRQNRYLDMNCLSFFTRNGVGRDAPMVYRIPLFKIPRDMKNISLDKR